MEEGLDVHNAVVEEFLLVINEQVWLEHFKPPCFSYSYGSMKLLTKNCCESCRHLWQSLDLLLWSESDVVNSAVCRFFQSAFYYSLKSFIFGGVFFCVKVALVISAWPSTWSPMMIDSTWKVLRSSWELKLNPYQATLTRACMWQNTTVNL